MYGCRKTLDSTTPDLFGSVYPCRVSAKNFSTKTTFPLRRILSVFVTVSVDHECVLLHHDGLRTSPTVGAPPKEPYDHRTRPCMHALISRVLPYELSPLQPSLPPGSKPTGSHVSYSTESGRFSARRTPVDRETNVGNHSLVRTRLPPTLRVGPTHR